MSNVLSVPIEISVLDGFDFMKDVAHNVEQMSETELEDVVTYLDKLLKKLETDDEEIEKYTILIT